MTLFSALADSPTIGFDPGWRLTFLKADDDGAVDRDDPIEFTRSHYEATINVTRSTDFTPATFEVSISGLDDEEFAKLADRRFVDIELGWRDLSDESRFAGALNSLFSIGEGKLQPVVLGRVTSVERSSGAFNYITTFRGIDQASHALRCRPGCTPASEGAACPALPVDKTATELVEHVAREHISVISHSAGTSPTFPNPPTIDPEKTLWENINTMLRMLHAEGENRRIPAFTRRHDDNVVETLHVGSWDPSVDGDRPGGNHKLDAANGLADAQPIIEDNDACDSPFAVGGDNIAGYNVTLLGRPEIQPGDQVELDVDDFTPGGPLASLQSVATRLGEAIGLPGSGEPALFDVTSVVHNVSPATGFVSTVKVRPHPPDTTWVMADTARGNGDEAQRTAAALAARNRTLEGLFAEIGFVNRQNAGDETIEGQTWNRQRLGVLEGIAQSQEPDRAVSAPARAEPLGLGNLPYLTPFAWGKTGLVVPHYPGSRVANLHYRGSSYHSVVAGCLWDDGQEPTNADEGDWWLSLPTDVENIDAGDPAEVPLPSGPASHDLIDGSGGRAIHVAGFTITVGKGLMPEVGSRPDGAIEDELTISHVNNNAAIRIDSDGNIEIATDGDLTFRANKISAHVTDKFEIL